ncbi:hypothetical protein [Rathayibacter sp. VKM Ac-2805]|uniref:hypothetical protein n=1 Tax=Rathayibacter sp. VKM Ac-2805 TaxID=2609258 RepID=UPI00132022F1|nr:hypothetical protein [Rathayibacter sp. VKM Ac-2805]QHC72963.1 hypothetical protein GSU40_04145 [Rathayibacter sp. VKM Ac-2805]
MTATAPAATPHLGPVAAGGALAWAALAALLLLGEPHPAAVLVLVLAAAAATSLSVVAVARRQPPARRTGVVIGLLAPLLANAGLTPLAALVGPAVLGAVALVLAGELAVVAVLARRR